MNSSNLSADAGRVGKLTEAEAEFVSEMRHEDTGENRWQNFDPDFRQKDIARLIRRGWFERHVDLSGYRQYRWTEAGRASLSAVEGE